MELADLMEQYFPAFEANYGDRLLPGHRKAIDAILRCRTAESGEIQLQCTDCLTPLRQPRSCWRCLA